MHQQEQADVGEQQQQLQATSIADAPQTEPQPHECGVCLFIYDELERRPRNLPCGHSYCSMCVSALLQVGQLTCPSCRTNHCAPETNHFPISYALETLSKVMRTQQVEAASHTTGEVPPAKKIKITQRATAGLSSQLRSMIQEQSVSMDSLEMILQKELQQLSQYRAKLAGSQAEHTNLLKELDKLVQQHHSNMDLLQEQDVKVESFMKKGEEVQRELRNARGQLDQINTAQEALTTIDAINLPIVEAEEWLQHSREEIPNGTVLNTSFTVLVATKAALEVITEEYQATPDHATSGHPDCTIMEVVESIKERRVKLVDLRTEKLRKKLEAGQVFAVQKYEDSTYYSSKVISEQNKLYLHTLRNESPPQMVYTLQVDKALENLDYSNTSVFLDLDWPRTTSQRVYIRLKADTPLTRQFVTLCLGHTGLTYCNTNFVNVVREGNCDIVWGGDISSQTATSNQVLPPIEGDQCGDKVYVSEGMLVAKINVSGVAKRSQFGITVKTSGSAFGFGGFASYYCLGSLLSNGKSVVKEALKNIDSITDLKVLNCGILC